MLCIGRVSRGNSVIRSVLMSASSASTPYRCHIAEQFCGFARRHVVQKP